jgi:hypothetical protein
VDISKTSKNRVGSTREDSEARTRWKRLYRLPDDSTFENFSIRISHGYEPMEGLVGWMERLHHIGLRVGLRAGRSDGWRGFTTSRAERGRGWRGCEPEPRAYSSHGIRQPSCVARCARLPEPAAVEPTSWAGWSSGREIAAAPEQPTLRDKQLVSLQRPAPLAAAVAPKVDAPVGDASFYEAAPMAGQGGALGKRAAAHIHSHTHARTHTRTHTYTHTRQLPRPIPRIPFPH